MELLFSSDKISETPLNKSFSRSLAKGNLINWDTARWHIDEGMEWVEKSMDEVCLLPKPKDTIFPELRTNEDSHLLCNKLKGEMTVTDSQAKQNALVREYQRAIPGTFSDISK